MSVAAYLLLAAAKENIFYRKSQTCRILIDDDQEKSSQSRSQTNRKACQYKWNSAATANNGLHAQLLLVLEFSDMEQRKAM